MEKGDKQVSFLKIELAPTEDKKPFTPDQTVSLPKKKEFQIPEGFKYTGPSLRQLREQCGISLEQLADRSKIRVQILKALEEENIKELPATVYIKGFLSVYVKLLGLNEQEVIEDYLESLETVK